MPLHGMNGPLDHGFNSFQMMQNRHQQPDSGGRGVCSASHCHPSSSVSCSSTPSKYSPVHLCERDTNQSSFASCPPHASKVDRASHKSVNPNSPNSSNSLNSPNNQNKPIHPINRTVQLKQSNPVPSIAHTPLASLPSAPPPPPPLPLPLPHANMMRSMTNFVPNQANDHALCSQISLIPESPNPPQGACSLVWSNLTYTVSSVHFNVRAPWCPWKRSPRIILDGLSGHINSGELVALIGPSGVGKSSLLEILAGRRRLGVHGNVHLIQRSTVKYPWNAAHAHPHANHHANHHANQRVCNVSSQSMPEASISFISQHDHHLDMLTIHETLLYASQLKNSKRARLLCKHSNSALPVLRDVSEFHQRLVHSVLSDLGLVDAQHTSVGQCSGGQRRRLSIALELLSQPRLILMDEPTTGLDFVSAFKCIQTLRSLTLMPHPPGIITSIHQPSSVVLSQFHRVYTLAKGGKCMFEGQVHSLVPYLNNFRLRCPTHFNPADFAIQVANGDFGLTCVDQLTDHQRKCHEHIHQSLKLMPSEQLCVTSGCQSTLIKRSMKKIRDQMNKPTGSYLSQLQILIRRSWKCTWRQPTLSWLRIFQFAFTALLIANLHNYPVGQVNGCFSDLQLKHPSHHDTITSSAHPINTTADTSDMESDYEDMQTDSSTMVPTTPPQSNVSNEDPNEYADTHSFWLDWLPSWFSTTSSSPSTSVSSPSHPSSTVSSTEQYVQNLAKVKDNSILLFFSLMFWAMSSIVPTLLTFPAEMRVFRRERANGWYTCFSYYSAKLLVETPLVITCPLLFCLVFYPLTGQAAEWWRFALFYSVAIILCLIAQTLGLIVGAAFADDRLSAVFIGSVQSFPFFMVGGYLIRGSVVSVFVRPLWQFGYVRFAFSALILSVYGFGRCPSTSTSGITSAFASTSSSTPTTASTSASIVPITNHAHSNQSSQSLLYQIRSMVDEDDFNCLHDSYYTEAGNQVDQLLSHCNLSLPAMFTRKPLHSLHPVSSAHAHSHVVAQDSSFVLSYYEVSNDSFLFNILYLLGTLVLLQTANYLLLVRSARKEVRD